MKSLRYGQSLVPKVILSNYVSRRFVSGDSVRAPRKLVAIDS